MNNEGVTIIDIPDPTHPRYCFLPGCDSPGADLDMTPLTAKAYLDTLSDSDKYNEALANGVEDGSAGDCSASSDDLPSVTTSSAAKADPSIVQALAINNVKAIAEIISQSDRYLNVMQAVRSIGGPFPDDLSLSLPTSLRQHPILPSTSPTSSSLASNSSPSCLRTSHSRL